jgi:hypothetical protein
LKGENMLLVRFTLLVLATVAAIIGVAILDTWWSVVLATVVTLALLTMAAIEVFRYLSASDNRSAADEELLEAGGFVEGDTGLPSRRRWRQYTARMYAEQVADRGTVPVPAAWRGPDAARRVLLVTTGPIDPPVIDEILHGDDPDELGVLVIVPTLADRPVRLRVGDASEAASHAQAVLNETLDALRGSGIRATGHIGAADPAVAVSDGLRTYSADLVVVARHRNGGMRHLEDVPVDGAAAAFGVPMREVDLSEPAPDAPRSLATTSRAAA